MQNVHAMRPEVRADYEAARAVAHGDMAFEVRFERFFTELRDPLCALYGDDPRFADAWERLLRAVAATAAARSDELRVLDHEREITPDWLQREQAVGYVTYVDRFAGTVRGVRDKLPYLRELGVTYLHLMPLLHARPAPNDGGYAVIDYAAVDPALGTMDDLRALADDLRAEGMALCVDVVLNHTAAEHPWTREHPDYYRTFPDRVEPDLYERTLPDVFPDTAPGSFTQVSDRWVWTTFNAYQWDLDYTNPDVFVAMTSAMLGLAAVGVDVLRLDAAPFLWKRVGTNCQNQPEVHELLQAFRAALRIAAPAVAFKAEAIVAPRDLVPYLGTGRHEGKECDLAYHNVLMVLLWSALASGRVALMTSTLKAMPPVPPGAGWLTYVRCHDDIGWAITPEDAGRVGEDAYLHRRFLADFYAGDFPGTFARGARFQPDPRTGEARTSGTCASLAGLESAPDPYATELAVRRILLLYAVAFAHGGLPLIYMGDELGLLNDPAGAADPDSRWMHRPFMDWQAAERRHDPASVEGRLWAGLRRLVAARRSTRAIHVQGVVEPLFTGNDHVFGLCRRQAGEALLVVANFTADPQPMSLDVVRSRGFDLTGAAEVDGRDLDVSHDFVVLAPYQHLWFGE
ncbi:amylosucrase [Solirubrobacter soli]|uniref:amylosucrase n=1 Tax=Solirubrobacter soli TaxID=363832 RepID=UPI000415FC2D|nr:amylosucrase [Solirubrobacter soli]